jgi:cytochrome P450
LKLSGLTHEEVLAQGILFFLAGFETTASTLSFLGYLLAVNSECQDKLIAEIDETLQGQVSSILVANVVAYSAF